MAIHYRNFPFSKLRLSVIVGLISIIRFLNSSENTHFDELILKDAEVLPAEANTGTLESRSLLSFAANSRLFSPSENKLSKLSVTWADFLLLPKEKLRTAMQIRPNSPTIERNICPPTINSNLSLKLGGADYDWCKWALSETGAKVKVVLKCHSSIISPTFWSDFDQVHALMITVSYSLRLGQILGLYLQLRKKNSSF